jgi:hypothetical protein
VGEKEQSGGGKMGRERRRLGSSWGCLGGDKRRKGVAGGSRHARFLREPGTRKKRNRGVRWVFFNFIFLSFF